MGDDCNDSDASVHPSASEICDGLDNNCDSSIPTDEQDNDSDGYVECSFDVTGWDGSSTVTGGDDCDDATATTHPGAAENETNTSLCHADADLDGYGDSSATGSVAVGTDCNDSDAAINPSATEIPVDSVDQDCDAKEICYLDADQDGVGSATEQLSASIDCSASGVSTTNTDCNDLDGTVTTNQTYYADADGDTFGDVSNTVSECLSTPSSGNVTDNTDCDDAVATTFPGAAPNDSATACMADEDGDDYGADDAPTGGGRERTATMKLTPSNQVFQRHAMVRIPIAVVMKAMHPIR